VSASYGWQVVRPVPPDHGFSAHIASILVHHFLCDDHRILLDRHEVDASDLPFLRGLYAGLPGGDDAVSVRQMIEDIERHGLIRLTVST
jgi:hypothetical protein